MCIRDRVRGRRTGTSDGVKGRVADLIKRIPFPMFVAFGLCLLYTSDAADERSSVDLGGRRIIKKKKRNYI